MTTEKIVCLIIDDELDCREINTEIAESLGFITYSVESVDKAIEFCKKTMPDFIMLDLNMPEKNGLQFLKEANNIFKDKIPYILICSAIGAGTEMSESYKNLCSDDMRADDFLFKPYGVSDVEKKLRESSVI